MALACCRSPSCVVVVFLVGPVFNVMVMVLVVLDVNRSDVCGTVNMVLMLATAIDRDLLLA